MELRKDHHAQSQAETSGYPAARYLNVESFFQNLDAVNSLLAEALRANQMRNRPVPAPPETAWNNTG